MTAYLYWDTVWKSTRGHNGWTKPDDWVLQTAAAVKKLGAVTALDLGCGVGRHALQFCRMGLRSSGFDRSPEAVAIARTNAAREQADIDFSMGDIAELPYEDSEFDYVLAFNVVYHGDEDALTRTLAEVHRVVRPGGWYQATMLSKRNVGHGRGLEVSPNTFRQPDAKDDKVHEHLYCSFGDIARLHPGFELISAVDVEHEAPGSFHWHCLFEVRDT